MIAVGYARVSTDQQAAEGCSLAAQQSAILRMSGERGFSCAAIYVEEGLSGSRADNRPELERALEHACRERGVLIVYSLSRLARSTKDAIEIAARLSKSRANLASLSEHIDTTTPGGTFVFTVLSAVAQLERDQISERTRAALQYKKSQGQRVSRFAPYGCRFEQATLDGQAGVAGELVVVVDEAEQEVIATILALRRDHHRSPAIARLLQEAGIETRTGSPWRASSVRRIIACHGS